jgi:hypothetical protein
MSYETKSYQDIRKLCVERGINGNGTREDLIARLYASDGAQGSVESENATAPATTTNSAPQAASEPTEDTADKKKVEREWRADSKKMKANLEKQGMVRIMIPLEPGEKAINGRLVPFTVNLNGFRQTFPRGEFVNVPNQIAEIIQERLESEGKIGRQWRIDADEARVTALGE